MLYVYKAIDFETDKKIKEVVNCKDLKDFDGSYYVGKTESIISNGKEIIADESFGDFIYYYFKECVCIDRMDEYAEIRINYINVVYSRENALNYLVENLDFYENRIFNSKDMFKEILIILDKIMISYLNSTIQKLQRRFKMKTYCISVNYYIQAENKEELESILEDHGITNSEYYSSYEIVDVEDEE